MKKKIKFLSIIIATLFLTVSFIGCQNKDNSNKNATSSNEIRVGCIKAIGTVTPFVAEQEKFFEKAGVKVKVLEFADGSSLAEAYAAGEVDVAVMGIAPTATWYEKGVDLQVIAGANGGGHVLLVRSDSGINSVKDLKGKVIAEPGVGTVTDTLLRDYILKNSQIDPEKDVTIQSGMKPADMATSLYVTKEVDAIITWEPYVTQAQEQFGNDVKILYDSGAEIKKATGSSTFYPVNVVSAKKEFIENHSEELNKFISVYKETVDFINNDESADKVIGETLQLDENVIKSSKARVDFNYNIDEEGLSTTLIWAKDLGYLDSIPDSKEFYNYEFLK